MAFKSKIKLEELKDLKSGMISYRFAYLNSLNL